MNKSYEYWLSLLIGERPAKILAPYKDKLCALSKTQAEFENLGLSSEEAQKAQAVYEIYSRLTHKKQLAHINSSCDVAEKYMPIMRCKTQEEFWVILMNHHNDVIKEACLFKGAANAVSIDPKQIFIEALAARASNMIIMHNHPSGRCRPSRDDNMLTDTVKQAGNIIGVQLLDHIIIGDQCYYSYHEENKLDKLFAQEMAAEQ